MNSRRQNLSLNQQMRQTQTLSPLQVRYFKMLEMNESQVEDEVRRTLDENPALEAVSDNHDLPEESDFHETAEQMQLADYRSEEDIPFYRLHANNRSADDTTYQSESVADAPTLFDIIVEQARLAGLEGDELDRVIFIAGNLDDNGYLTRTPAQMASDYSIMTGREVSTVQIRSALERLRSFDPAGIGATDLRECLLLQLLRHRGDETAALALEIVTHYFDLFSKKHYDRLQSALGVNAARLREAVERIRTLNPKPGLEVQTPGSEDRLSHITPDFQVDVDADGTLTLQSLSRVPELRIEASFVRDMPGHSKANLFIRRQRDEASGFIGIVSQRAITLNAVMQAIVDRQRDFFRTGDEAALRPMVLRDISADTGYDASVVSRATMGKYVLTPWGAYSLKFFFNERFSGDSDLSSREIISAMRAIIEAEDRSRPLSDEAVAAELGSRGFNVARRTVTKYREQSGIPVARLRREL